MIDQLDIVLRKLITSTIAGFASDDQIRFQPPDDDWRTYVKTLAVGGQPANALNLYLVDLRENRKLRSNEKLRTAQNGDVTETVVPRRLDCHYLISAWSPADVTPALEPTLDEHAALYLVAAELARHDPIVPAAIYAPGPVPATFPPAFAEAEMPIAVVPPEGFIKLAEFWGTMGEKHRWRPVIYLIVTLPILTPGQARRAGERGNPNPDRRHGARRPGAAAAGGARLGRAADDGGRAIAARQHRCGRSLHLHPRRTRTVSAARLARGIGRRQPQRHRAVAQRRV